MKALNEITNKVLLLFSLFFVIFVVSKHIYANDEVNVPYNTISTQQKLDIFYSKGNSKKNPVVVYLHGGSYTNGNKGEFQKESRELFNQNGYTYVALDYRLKDEGLFPAAVDDVKTAIRFLKENKNKYKIDPNRIYIIGHSAGANLGSLVASTSGLEALGDEEILYEKNNSKIAGMIGVGGFYDVDKFLANKEKNNSKKVVKKIKLYYETNNTLDILKRNNINYVKNISIPMLLQHGELDRVVTKNETLNYCSMLKYRSNNENVKCQIIQDTRHVYSEFFKENNKKVIIDWLNNN
ncbi:acetyl esterase/lipase [Bacilli bacterium PM5-9]|nr:acetyl esterase/lipase [Bacilli bacterium PM5-9]